MGGYIHAKPLIGVRVYHEQATQVFFAPSLRQTTVAVVHVDSSTLDDLATCDTSALVQVAGWVHGVESVLIDVDDLTRIELSWESRGKNRVGCEQSFGKGEFMSERCQRHWESEEVGTKDVLIQWYEQEIYIPRIETSPHSGCTGKVRSSAAPVLYRK